MKSLKHLTANCKEATLLSMKKEEEGLSFSSRMKLYLHLLYCASCRRFVKQSAIITTIAAHYKNELAKAPSATISSERKEAIQKQINDSL